MPIPATSMIALGTAIENSDGRLPSMVSPAAKAMRLPTPSTSATTAATVTAPGRSPGASGSSLARASALRCSEREGGLSAISEREGGFSAVAVAEGVGRRGSGVGLLPAGVVFLRLRLRRPNALFLADQRLAQRSCRRARIVGLRDRAHDDRPPRSRGGHRADRSPIDPADREPRVGGVDRRMADQL